MNRIDTTFLELRKKNKKAFIAYLTVGFPTVSFTQQLITQLSKSSVDMFELGMPFSDPLADGPIIQQSSAHALRHHVTLDSVFSLTRRLRKKTQKPLLMMGYCNPVLQYGIARFAKNARAAGLDGVIIPDLPIEESRELKRCVRKHGLHVINFIAPTTDHARIKTIAKNSQGFIYYVSVTGTTGMRQKLSSQIRNEIRYIRRHTKTPVCVGFGISNKKTFRAVTQFSDGAIVGSAIIRCIQNNSTKKNLVARVARFVQHFTA